MWKVPANASRGSTEVSRSRGSRLSSMLTLSCAPSGLAGGSAPSSPARACGEALTSTSRAARVRVAVPSSYVTSATLPSVAMPVTSAPVTISAPAARAASASASVKAPMPPIGTSQSPVPPPITW